MFYCESSYLFNLKQTCFRIQNVYFLSDFDAVFSLEIIFQQYVKGFDYIIFHILSNNYGFSFLGPTLRQVSDYRLIGASSYIFLSRFTSLKLDSRCSLLSTWPGLAMQIQCYIVNFIIIIIILNLSVFIFLSGMGCYVLNILLSSRSRTVGSGIIPHQTPLQENSSLKSRQ